MKAEDWIERLGMKEHPEGGWFVENWRNPEKVLELPDRYKGERSWMTSIYFLLGPGEFSALHRLQTDELWVHIDGHDLEIRGIAEDGAAFGMRLGKSLKAQAQVIAPMRSWFGAAPVDPAGYTLSACILSPGFEFADFELGQRDQLLKSFPDHSGLIRSLTRA